MFEIVPVAVTGKNQLPPVESVEVPNWLQISISVATPVIEMAFLILKYAALDVTFSVLLE